MNVEAHARPAVDGHHHLWDPSRSPLPWLTAEHADINRVFAPEDLEPQLRIAGVTQTVVVQSANLDADTDLMFEWAADCEWIGAVVGWVDLRDPARTAERLEELDLQPKLRGIRHLIHDELDPHWIVRLPVLESLSLLEQRGLVLELPVVFPRHLGDVPELARSFPRLTIVIDHLGKPPIGTDAMPRWAQLLGEAASYPNVAAKISGLNTAFTRRDWTADDLRPAVETALQAFGPDRLLCGSDWPVALLNGDYGRVWAETRRLLEKLAPDFLDALLAGSARRLYRLPEPAAVSNSVAEDDGAH